MKNFKKNKEVEKVLNSIKTKQTKYWKNVEEKNSLKLFYLAAKKVPAYKDFLKKHKIQPSSIKTYDDLSFVPHTTKNNYLRKYSLKDLSWGGTLKSPLVLTSTSGSTGEPTYFTRNSLLDWQSSVIHELFFNNRGFKSNEPTLVIDGFGMGVWIGGLITYQAFKAMEERDYLLSILTTGINKEEIFKGFKKLAPNFKQIILTGYPPFIKDIVDECPRRNIDLKKYNIRFLFAAEAFTEKFRNYIAKKSGINNPLFDTMNIYGSADIGTMSFETPLSILIRQLAVKKPKLFNDVFPSVMKTPTLTQYIPEFISFETRNGGDILLTGNNSIPLIRYSIGDHGGVFSFDDIVKKFKKHGVNLTTEAKKAGISKYMYQLPFIYVYERINMSTTLYGLQIYPETIKEVLLESPFDKFLTGKFTIITKFNSKQDQYLEINLELQNGSKVSKSIEKTLIEKIIKNLRSKNSEFRELSDHLKNKVKPRLVFWPSEDPMYFKPGIKQKWVKK